MSKAHKVLMEQIMSAAEAQFTTVPALRYVADEDEESSISATRKHHKVYPCISFMGKEIGKQEISGPFVELMIRMGIDPEEDIVFAALRVACKSWDTLTTVLHYKQEVVRFIHATDANPLPWKDLGYTYTYHGTTYMLWPFSRKFRFDWERAYTEKIETLKAAKYNFQACSRDHVHMKMALVSKELYDMDGQLLMLHRRDMRQEGLHISDVDICGGGSSEVIKPIGIRLDIREEDGIFVWSPSLDGKGSAMKGTIRIVSLKKWEKLMSGLREKDRELYLGLHGMALDGYATGTNDTVKNVRVEAGAICETEFDLYYHDDSTANFDRSGKVSLSMPLIDHIKMKHGYPEKIVTHLENEFDQLKDALAKSGFAFAAWLSHKDVNDFGLDEDGDGGALAINANNVVDILGGGVPWGQGSETTTIFGHTMSWMMRLICNKTWKTKVDGIFAYIAANPTLDWIDGYREVRIPKKYAEKYPVGSKMLMWRHPVMLTEVVIVTGYTRQVIEIAPVNIHGADFDGDKMGMIGCADWFKEGDEPINLIRFMSELDNVQMPECVAMHRMTTYDRVIESGEMSPVRKNSTKGFINALAQCTEVMKNDVGPANYIVKMMRAAHVFKSLKVELKTDITLQEGSIHAKKHSAGMIPSCNITLGKVRELGAQPLSLVHRVLWAARRNSLAHGDAIWWKDDNTHRRVLSSKPSHRSVYILDHMGYKMIAKDGKFDFLAMCQCVDKLISDFAPGNPQNADYWALADRFFPLRRTRGKSIKHLPVPPVLPDQPYYVKLFQHYQGFHIKGSHKSLTKIAQSFILSDPMYVTLFKLIGFDMGTKNSRGKLGKQSAVVDILRERLRKETESYNIVNANSGMNEEHLFPLVSINGMTTKFRAYWLISGFLTRKSKGFITPTVCNVGVDKVFKGMSLFFRDYFDYKIEDAAFVVNVLFAITALAAGSYEMMHRVSVGALAVAANLLKEYEAQEGGVE